MPGLVISIPIPGHPASSSDATTINRHVFKECFHVAGNHHSRKARVSIAWTCDSTLENTVFAYNKESNFFCATIGECYSNNSTIEGAPLIEKAYKQFGRDFPAKGLTEGAFTAVVVDESNEETLIYTDRYGLERIYSTRTSTHLHLSSDAGALLKSGLTPREFDTEGLAQWYAHGATFGERSLFQGISILPPGSLLVFRNGIQIFSGRHSEFRTKSCSENLTELLYRSQIKDILPSLIHKTLHSDTTTSAVSLTGGLDGRLIAAGLSPHKASCYTFSGPIKTCRDNEIAQRLAQQLGWNHSTIRIDKDFFANFIKLAGNCIEASSGYMDVTGAAEIYVNKKARIIAPLRITGNYGSEILRDNICLKRHNFHPKALTDDIAKKVAAAASDLPGDREQPALQFILNTQLPYFHHARYSVESSQLRVRSPFLSTALVQASLFTAPQYRSTENQTMRIIADFSEKLAKIPTDRGTTFPSTYTSRVKREIINFLTKVEYALDYGMPNSLAPLAPILFPRPVERLFLGTQKFCHYRSWYRDQLSSSVKEQLLDPRSLSRSYIDRKSVQALVSRHIAGVANATTEISKLLTLELINRNIFCSPKESHVC